MRAQEGRRHSPVLIDLDGTLADSGFAIMGAVRAACEAVGICVDGTDLSFCLGPPLHSSLERLGVPPERLAEASLVFQEHHWGPGVRHLAPMPGAREALSAFARAGIPCGVVTIKPTRPAWRVLETIGLRDRITAVVGRDDDLDPRTKTDLLREALEHPLLDGPSPVYIGDLPSDEEAAFACGVPYLMYPRHDWTAIRAVVLDHSDAKRP